MSKVFEQAYRELAQTEIPGLWDRIEAGLSEKSAPAVLQIDETEVKTQETTTETITTVERKTNRNRNKVLVFMKKYSTVAAAIVCVAILIPAISLIGQFGIGGSKSESAMEAAMEAPAAPAEMWEEAADEAPAEMMEEYAYAEAVEEASEEETIEEYVEAAVAEESEYEEAVATEGAAQESILNDAAADVEKAESIEESGEEARAEKAEEKQVLSTESALLLAEKCPEGTIVRDVQIKVTEVSEMTTYFEGTDREEMGYICSAEVEAHPEGLLTEGEQIDIFISGYSSVALMKNGVFKLDLESFVSEEKCYFEIKQYHMQLEP